MAVLRLLARRFLCVNLLGPMTFVVIVGGMVLQLPLDMLKTLLWANAEAASWTLFGLLCTVFLFMVVCSVQPAESLLSTLNM